MRISQFCKVRDDLFEEQYDRSCPLDFGYGKSEQFVPVTDKNGQLQTVGMMVEFKPVHRDFRTYNPESMIEKGNIQPLSTYTRDIFGRIDQFQRVISKNNSVVNSKFVGNEKE